MRELTQVRAFGISIALAAAVSFAHGCSRTDRADVATGAAAADAAPAASGNAAPSASENTAPASEPERVATPMHPARQKAPDFALTQLDGRTVRLKDFEGKVVLIDFWATWCGPCRMSIPHLIELQKEYGDDGFSVIGISLDRAGMDAVAAFATRAGINYPVVMGNGAVQLSYGGIQSIPTAFLVDREGYVVRVFQGFQPKPVLEGEITPLLES